MINKVNEEWGKVEQTAKRGPNPETEEWKTLVKSIVGVREALKRMCDVSVTRTTLHSAVKEALASLISGHEKELFPEVFREVASLRAQIEKTGVAHADSMPASAVGPGVAQLPPGLSVQLDAYGARLDGLSGQLEGLEAQVQGQGGDVADLRDKVSEVDLRLVRSDSSIETLAQDVRENLQALQKKLEEADERHSSRIGHVQETIEDQLRGGLLIVEERLEKARTYLTGLLSKLEASVPAIVGKGTGELEVQLRKEIDEMVQSLSDKIADLRGMLARIEEAMPRRETLEEKFEALRTQLSSISSGVGETGQGVGKLGESISSSLSELKSLLDAGLQRWETDQSMTLERLQAVRDTLRDQFTEVDCRVKDASKTLWGKLSGKGKGGLRLTQEEWDQVAAKLEAVLSCIDAVLAKRKGS